MEQIQSNLEIEIKLKNDALKIKKKLEMEYKELEMEYTLETANKTIADYLREIKKLESELGNLQVLWSGSGSNWRDGAIWVVGREMGNFMP